MSKLFAGPLFLPGRVAVA